MPFVNQILDIDCKKDKISPCKWCGLIPYPSSASKEQILVRNNFMDDYSFIIDFSQHVNINHCTYHDQIESLLEDSFYTRLFVNNNFLILSLLK